MCYTKDANITDHQFLYIDLIALVPLSIFSAWTGAHEKLNKEVPTATLFYKPVIVSVIMSATIQLAFQVYFFINVEKQVFYQPPWNIGDDTIANERIVSY
jgi:hypothetical protein